MNFIGERREEKCANMLIRWFVISVLLSLVRQNTSDKGCAGGFDLYFILDRSRSVSVLNFQNRTVQFVQGILNELTSSKLRVSFVTFSDRAELALPLTGQKSKIKTGINYLKGIRTYGRTYLEYGIDKALEQIKVKGLRTASVVIILTDGELSEKNSFAKANLLRKNGATVFAVGVERYLLSELEGLANKPSKDYVFTVTNYEALGKISQQVINKACIEIVKIDPEQVCLGEKYSVTLHGRGFLKAYDASNIICSFLYNSTQRDESKPTHSSDTRIECDGVVIDVEGRTVEVQMSVNGNTFISSDVHIVGTKCIEHDYSSVVVAMLFLLILLALIGLWWFWSLLPCVKAPLKSADIQLLPESTAEAEVTTKKWPTVDTSYYGGGGVGGVKPVRVKWGNKGATDAGNRLMQTPDAKVINTEDDVFIPETNHPTSSLIDRLKAPFATLGFHIMKLYARVSSVRPKKGGSSVLYSKSTE